MKTEQTGSQRSRVVSFSLGAVMLVLLAILVAPQLFGVQVESSGEPSVVAIVDGVDISQEELEAEAAAQLDQVEATRLQCETDARSQRHTVLENAVERAVRKRLLEAEAESRGIDSDAVVGEIRKGVPETTQEEIDSWWEANNSRVQKPKEDVEEQIKQLLTSQRQQKVETSFFEALKDRYGVSYLLEPLRFEVAYEGFPSTGPDDAAVTIVEFSDFECPYCKRVLPTIEQVKNNFRGQVRFVFRQYPLSMHANAAKAAEASLCANDQGKFWEMHDLLFEEQRKLTIADLKDKASRLELDGEVFGECLDSSKYAEQVSTDVVEGSKAGVSGTPAMFVNGRFLSGAVPYEKLAKIVSEEIRRAATK